MLGEGNFGAGPVGEREVRAGAILERAKLGEQHIIGSLVLRVHLEHCALKVLYRVGLAVQVRFLLKFVGNRIALLGQATVTVPVVEELPAYRMARLLEQGSTRSSAGFLPGSTIRIFPLVLKDP